MLCEWPPAAASRHALLAYVTAHECQSGMRMLQLEQVTKSYAGGPARVAVLRGVDFIVSPGETVALTGESGSGKSTLLHLIAGLDDVDGGRISLDGQALSGLDDAGRARLRRDRLGLVFQQFNLVPSLKVADNLAFQARLAGRLDAAWQRELVDRLGLADLLHRFPEQLSGGQQQRVAIGRALAIRPGLILADEPTGNLDETTGDAVLALCLDLVARSGAALLMVTHSERLAGHLDRRLHLSAGRLV
jgi:putative ABC transport system ATP-binding protein